MERPRAVLLDIDGVLTVSWEPLPGAIEALAQIRAAGLPTVLLTNTTSRSRTSIASALGEAGFPADESAIVTAPIATVDYLTAHHPGARCLVLSSGDIDADLGAVHRVDDDPDVVVLGGAGPEFSYPALNMAFQALLRGAPLVAMHANRYWRTSAGMQLDTGAFVAGLQEAAGVRATVVGKPAREFFDAALRIAGVGPQDALMVGDDVDADVLAAQDLGITGVLVRTGKYTDQALDDARARPDYVLDSVADLPELLGLP